APGGDDYQNVWINPNNPDIILLGSDQGAIVTVDGGKTWSSWYNQSTAQLYHVSADNAFPYRLYSGQQESGSVGIKSRGDEGEITEIIGKRSAWIYRGRITSCRRTSENTKRTQQNRHIGAASFTRWRRHSLNKTGSGAGPMTG